MATRVVIKTEHVERTSAARELLVAQIHQNIIYDCTIITPGQEITCYVAGDSGVIIREATDAEILEYTKGAPHA